MKAILGIVAIAAVTGMMYYFSMNKFRGETCGGNCPSGTCTSCPCGSTKLSYDIATECAKYSAWNQACCKCIVSHESGGNAHAVYQNTGGSHDVGFWQVNSMNWASCNGGKAPCDIDANRACAEKVWAWGGKTWKLWSTAKTCGCTNTFFEEMGNSN
jgi:hypothetical protein